VIGAQPGGRKTIARGSVSQRSRLKPRNPNGHRQRRAQVTGPKRAHGADIKGRQVKVLKPAILIRYQNHRSPFRVGGKGRAQGQDGWQAFRLARLQPQGHLCQSAGA